MLDQANTVERISSFLDIHSTVSDLTIDICCWQLCRHMIYRLNRRRYEEKTTV